MNLELSTQPTSEETCALATSLHAYADSEAEAYDDMDILIEAIDRAARVHGACDAKRKVVKHKLHELEVKL